MISPSRARFSDQYEPDTDRERPIPTDADTPIDRGAPALPSLEAGAFVHPDSPLSTWITLEERNR